MKTIRLLLCFMLSALFTKVNAQNVKKIFKYIEKDKIEEAVLELKKIDSKEKYERKEVLLIQLGTCIILSNEKCQSFKPYEAYHLFKSMSISNLESNEVEDFLSKYDLNLIKVSDLIFKGILIEAKKIDTEASYDAALYVCKPCNYDLEIRNLKSKAAYNECINKGTVEGYKYFIEMYANTEYLNEVTELLNKKAFDEAKSTMTIESMNDFINNYSNTLLKNSAIEIRDSLALPLNQKNYTSLLKYTKQYPNSKYTPKIIQELPDILYNEALTKNSVESLKKFINEYPSDSRASEIKNKLEIAYYNFIKKSFSTKEFTSFKSQFPNSTYINELNSISAKVMENSDLFKEGLKGSVKSIETSIYDNSRKENIFNSKKEFNESGKIKSITSDSDFSDKIEDFEMSYMPKEFDEELLVVLPFCRTKGTLHIGNKKEYGFGGSTNLLFEYDSEGKLVSVDNKKFIYDVDGNLIEKNYHNKSTPGGYSPTVDGWAINKIKYKWQNGKLVSKYEYNDKGDRYDEFYDVEYNNNEQIIKAYTYSKDEPIYVITNTFDAQGNIINKKHVSGKDYNYKGTNLFDSWQYNYFYVYTNGKITEIGNMKKTYKDMFGGKVHILNEKKTTVLINRDSQGNILSIEKDMYGKFEHDTEWTYEYDAYGNWIKRSEFDVKNGDIKIIKKRYTVTRSIIYY